MLDERNRRLKAAGERIARRSVARAKLRWRLYRIIHKIIGDTVAARIKFTDYIVGRTETKGRVTSLVSIRPDSSRFSAMEQEEAAGKSLRELIAEEPGGTKVTITTSFSRVSTPHAPPFWTSKWCANWA
jgi:hypothetical protein